MNLKELQQLVDKVKSTFQEERKQAFHDEEKGFLNHIENKREYVFDNTWDKTEDSFKELMISIIKGGK